MKSTYKVCQTEGLTTYFNCVERNQKWVVLITVITAFALFILGVLAMSHPHGFLNGIGKSGAIGIIVGSGTVICIALTALFFHRKTVPHESNQFPTILGNNKQALKMLNTAKNKSFKNIEAYISKGRTLNENKRKVEKFSKERISEFIEVIKKNPHSFSTHQQLTNYLEKKIEVLDKMEVVQPDLPTYCNGGITLNSNEDKEASFIVFYACSPLIPLFLQIPPSCPKMPNSSQEPEELNRVEKCRKVLGDRSASKSEKDGCEKQLSFFLMKSLTFESRYFSFEKEYLALLHQQCEWNEFIIELKRCHSSKNLIAPGSMKSFLEFIPEELQAEEIVFTKQSILEDPPWNVIRLQGANKKWRVYVRTNGNQCSLFHLDKSQTRFCFQKTLDDSLLKQELQKICELNDNKLTLFKL